MPRVSGCAAGTPERKGDITRLKLAPFRRIVRSYGNSAHTHAYDTPNDAIFRSPKSQPPSRGTREQQMIARMEVVVCHGHQPPVPFRVGARKGPCFLALHPVFLHPSVTSWSAELPYVAAQPFGRYPWSRFLGHPMGAVLLSIWLLRSWNPVRRVTRRHCTEPTCKAGNDR